MKTAMQELIDKVQSINERYDLKGDSVWLMNEIIDHIEISLEEEKQQLDDMFEEGFESAYQHFVNGKDFVQFEEYYNQTYNQNK
jgi:hypothetical protein